MYIEGRTTIDHESLRKLLIAHYHENSAGKYNSIRKRDIIRVPPESVGINHIIYIIGDFRRDETT